MGGRGVQEPRYGDRRQRVRFEIVGDMWATLEFRPICRLVNLGEGGALVESSHRIPVGSHCSVSLTVGAASALASVVVRHVSPPLGGPRAGYRIGLEFVKDESARDQLRAVLAAAAGGNGTSTVPAAPEPASDVDRSDRVASGS